MEAIEDMQRLAAFFANDLQIWLPHVGANERNLRGHLFADRGEEPLERLDGSFLSYPKQARDVRVDLIDQGQVFVPLGVLDFVDADGVNLSQSPVFQAPGDD